MLKFRRQMQGKIGKKGINPILFFFIFLLSVTYATIEAKKKKSTIFLGF